MRKAITLLLGSSILFTSGAALAQYQQGGQAGGQYGGTYQPQYSRPSNTDNIGGSDGQFVFGVDRVMGVFAHSEKIEPEGSTTTNSTTEIALFGSGASEVHSVPRLSLDYFVVEGFSIGGSFVLVRLSGETEVEPDEGDSVTRDAPTITGILFQPRLGYSFVVDETFAVWPRGGITFATTSAEVTETNITTGEEETTTITNSSLALTLEVPVVISPIENFAFTVGPFVDFGVSGNNKVEPDTGDTIETDRKLTSFGLAVGVAGYY